MTEQPPSASKEALELVSRLRRVCQQLPNDSAATHPTIMWFELNLLDAGKAIDALCEQRVSAETVQWQNRDRQRLEQILLLQETVQSLQSAKAERPAPEGPQQSGDIVRWGVLRLLSGDLTSNEEKVDAELDLDDFQFWFQENPKHTGFKQILINLSGEQWGKLKELPLVEERSRHSPPSALASTGADKEEVTSKGDTMSDEAPVPLAEQIDAVQHVMLMADRSPSYDAKHEHHKAALHAVLATLQQHERAMAALRKIADAREFVCDGVSAGCCYGYATKEIAEKMLMAALDDAASAAATPAGNRP